MINSCAHFANCRSSLTMKLLNLMLVASATIATVHGYTFEGNVAGPCYIAAVYPAGNTNCPAADTNRAKCQALVQVQPDGQQIAGAGTESDPTLVPVKFTYVGNSDCNTDRSYNVSVWTSGSGTTTARFTTVNNGDETDTITGTSMSSAITGTFQGSNTAPICPTTWIVNNGSCFLSDLPAASAAGSTTVVAASFAFSALLGVVLATTMLA